MAKLRLAQDDKSHLLPATRLLAQAAELYEAAGDDTAAADCNAALYWARKRFTLSDTESLKRTDANAAARTEAIVSRKIDASESRTWLEKADEFARRSDDHLLIAIRYFEVASRFAGTDDALKAMEKSLKAMQEAKVVQPRKAESAPQRNAKQVRPVVTGGMIDITTLTPIECSVGFGVMTTNRSIDGVHFPRIDGKLSQKYLGTHAPARISYDIPAGTIGFEATAVRGADVADGVKFIVEIDGAQVHASKVLATSRDKELLQIRIGPGSKVLTLIVDPLNSQNSDHSFWVEPKFYAQAFQQKQPLRQAGVTAE
ncbi:MAG: NPCBM/NEW2 domain-containing protein, partial [Acidobacteriota bacterium]